MSFDKAFDHTVGLEGKYSNDPNDPGGETMWGITVAVARAYGYKGSMKDLPLGTAKMIYKDQYWDELKLDLIDVSSSVLSSKMFDMAVNMGVTTTARDFQRAVNTFNRKGKDYPDVPVDGRLGQVTINAFNSLCDARASTNAVSVMYKALNCSQGYYYMTIGAVNQKLEDFEFGWFINRVA